MNIATVILLGLAVAALGAGIGVGVIVWEYILLRRESDK
jgi:hypothetical protein